MVLQGSSDGGEQKTGGAGGGKLGQCFDPQRNCTVGRPNRRFRWDRQKSVGRHVKNQQGVEEVERKNSKNIGVFGEMNRQR